MQDLSAESLPEKLAPKQLAQVLGVSLAALARWRNRRVGPPYYREVSRIYYYRDEIEAWRQSARWG